ncbi:MAG: LTA synthase family protein [Planctomycetota bacterium]|nr:LTA synthase family protein [Planctomycetota bacterium]
MNTTPSSRGSVLRLLFVTFLVLSIVDRAVLLAWSPGSLAATPWELPLVFAVGAGLDAIAVTWLLLPATLYALFAPQRLLASRAQRVLTRALCFAALGAFLFDLVAGWVFWEEFTARFNFIAVDYLVYTTEVIDNIVESYPLVWVLSGLVGATCTVYLGVRRWLEPRLERAPKGGRWALVPFVLIPVLGLCFVDGSVARVSSDRYRNEVAMDGLYNLFAAFRSNTLDYGQNFAGLPEDEAWSRLHGLLASDGLEFASDASDELRRHHPSRGGEQRSNVMMIVVESLSADYLEAFVQDGKDLTPNLDALVQESLVYTNHFATGSRTVRGLEALTLSVPPTPGRSIVKRPDNEAMDSIGWQFRDRGYDTRFLYGGFGYFDNMNHYFSGNGFDIVDRADLAGDEVRFANAWGVCDEDIYARTLKEADASTASGKPFFQVVLTTSNHRPYTYPDVIAIPPGTGREGAVAYTDFAMGAFFDQAKQRDWYDDTIFVVVGDHCASSAGRRDLNLERHRVPLLLHAPGRIEPGRDDRLASQIDVAPTLLGLLDFDYTASYFGHDLAGPGEDRAFIGNYQTLGMVRAGRAVALGTKQGVQGFRFGADLELVDAPVDADLLGLTIAAYQSAAQALTTGKLKLKREALVARR